MAVVVWGTKVKTEPIGSVAIDCPFCGERVIGDAFRVLKASHVYYIRGKYREVQRYARCRLCAGCSEISNAITPAVFNQHNALFPTDDFISKTNPRLADTLKPGTSIYGQHLSQDEIHTFSLFNGIYNEIDSLKSSVRTNGNAEGLIFIVLLSALFLSMFLYDKFSNHTALFLTTLWTIATIIVVFLFRWQSSLRFNAAHKYLNIHLQRYMEYKHIRMQDLISLSSGLKGEFKVVRKYLSWAENRIDPKKYYTNLGYL